MEDVITDIPPPSRFFQDDLNNFAPPSPPLPTPFLLFPRSITNKPLRPSLLIIAISSPAHYLFHHVPSKSLIGSLILPENTFSGNSIEPSLVDKSLNIYTLHNTSDSNSISLVTVQCSVSAERAHIVAKLLIGEDIVPERVLILDSIQSRSFRGKLSPDETFAYKLETLSEKQNPLLIGVDYFPSGSVVDGLAAALLGRCQLKKIKGTLCLSWPDYGTSAIPLLKSLILKHVIPGLEFNGNDDIDDEGSKKHMIKDYPYNSDLYT